MLLRRGYEEARPKATDTEGFQAAVIALELDPDETGVEVDTGNYMDGVTFIGIRAPTSLLTPLTRGKPTTSPRGR